MIGRFIFGPTTRAAARRATERVIDLGRFSTRTPMQNFMREAVSRPRAIGMADHIYSADNVPLDMGLIASGGVLAAGAAAPVSYLAAKQDDINDSAADQRRLLRALRRQIARDRERIERGDTAHHTYGYQDGYWTGLEVEMDALNEDVRGLTDNTVADRRYGMRR
jgi:hypothetical protein